MSKHVRENNRGSVQDKRRALQNGYGAAQHGRSAARDVQGGRATAQNRRAAAPSNRVAAPANRGNAAAGRSYARSNGVPSRRPSASDPVPKNATDFIKKNVVYVIAVVITAGLIIGGLFLVRALFAENKVTTAEEGYTSPYDWSKLDRTNGHYQYVVDGQVVSRLGIDVSDHQRQINWNAVKADGVEFAFIRVGYRGATEGQLYLDERFRDNLDGAHAAGLDCGVYFFSQAQTRAEAVEEAEFVLAQLNGTELECPVSFDTEEKVLSLDSSRTTGLNTHEMTDIANAFCNRIEQAGYTTNIYGNAHDLSRFNFADLQGRPIWWAQYAVDYPTPNIDIAIWQYTESGQVNGIDGGVDLNIDLTGVLEQND